MLVPVMLFRVRPCFHAPVALLLTLLKGIMLADTEFSQSDLVLILNIPGAR